MADIPPTYEIAVSRDPWQYIIPRVDFRRDFYNLCLVSKEWNRRFTHNLWGQPWFKDDQDVGDIHYSFTLFLRCLKITRFEVRAWTLAVTTPFGLRNYDFEVESRWIYNLFALLPNLQTLSLSGIRVVDGASIKTLWSISSELGVATYPLKMLNLSFCQNVVSHQLSSALECMHGLAYLDLSNARSIDPRILYSGDGRILPSLQILKIAGLNIKDEPMNDLICALGTRLWSLDIRNNLLTDAAISVLLDFCFLPPAYSESATGSDSNLSKAAKEDDEEWHVRNCLGTWGSVRPNEYYHSAGLSHLYVSGNKVSATSLKSLLFSHRLAVLDMGEMSNSENAPSNSTSAEHLHLVRNIFSSGPSESNSPFKRLTWLRIDYRIIVFIAGYPFPNWDGYVGGNDRRIQNSGIENFAKNIKDLQLLIITNLPSRVRDHVTFQALAELLCALADNPQSHRTWSRGSQRRNLGQSEATSRTNPKRIGLQEMVLEVTMEREFTLNNDGERGNDRDISVLTDALKDDFSFFEDEKEAVGSTISKPLPRVTTDRSSGAGLSSSGGGDYHLVEKLVEFRKKSRAESFTRLSGGGQTKKGSGFWPGIVKISRSPTPPDQNPARRWWKPGMPTRWG